MCVFEFTFWLSDFLGYKYGPTFSLGFLQKHPSVKGKDGFPIYPSVCLWVQLENTIETHEKDWQHFYQIYKQNIQEALILFLLNSLENLGQICNLKWWNYKIGLKSEHLHYIPSVWFLLCINNTLLSLVKYNKYSIWILI